MQQSEIKTKFMTDTPTILKKILLRKQQEIAERSKRLPLSLVQKLAESAEPVRGFVDAIERKLAANQSAVIAEIKKASPSKGVLRADFKPAEIAQSYERAGAACLSVLTDQDFFQGHEDYLKQARTACQLPVIRKDFIIDPYQVFEARAIGADCILLIVAALDDSQLEQLSQLAIQLDMDVLVEVHNEEELQRASVLNLPLIGINNRDLHSFETSLDNTIKLLPFISDETIVITESGILSKEDVALMRQHGVNGFLIGETFMRAADPGEALTNLFN